MKLDKQVKTIIVLDH